MAPATLRRTVFVAGTVAALLMILPVRFANPAAGCVLSQTTAQTQNKKPAPEKKLDSTEQEVGPDDVIRIKTTLVNSPVLVIGRDGKYVPSLRREDFQIFEEGVKQDIAYFAPVEKPFTVALLLDTSRSTVFNLQEIQDAALSFVDNMRANDKALVVSFADDIEVLSELTGDPAQLRKAIRSCRPGGGTRVYDAIDFVLNQRLDPIDGRKALVVFTDGVDNKSNTATFESSLRLIEKTEALVYPVQFSTYDTMSDRAPRNRIPPVGSGFSKKDYQIADAFLHRAAEATGTALYPAYNISDLDRVVAQIIDELHNEYSVGYYPRTVGQPGEVRRVEVRVNRPQLVVRARTAYVVDETGAVMQPKNNGNVSTNDPATSGPPPVPRTFDQTKLPLGAKWMCKGPDVPTDFAVVKEGFISHCPKNGRPNDETNAWFIRKPGPTETICKGFLLWRGQEVAAAPIPTGYVVTAEVNTRICSNSNEPNSVANAWAVSLPQLTHTSCKGFSIPRGYVVVGEKDVPGCPAKPNNKNAWLIKPKS